MLSSSVEIASSPRFFSHRDDDTRGNGCRGSQNVISTSPDPAFHPIVLNWNLFGVLPWFSQTPSVSGWCTSAPSSPSASLHHYNYWPAVEPTITSVTSPFFCCTSKQCFFVHEPPSTTLPCSWRAAPTQLQSTQLFCPLFSGILSVTRKDGKCFW